MKKICFVFAFTVVLLAALKTNAQAAPTSTRDHKTPHLMRAHYQVSVAGRWQSSSINHAYDYEFENDGSYVFQKVAVANGARIVLEGRGTYQISGSLVNCHQTEVNFAGSPGQIQDESWSLDSSRGTLSRNGIVLTR